MDPYRTLAVEEVPEAPRDPGIVGDVIRQFADPKAFFRELVQNAIDAGSPTVEIRIERNAAAQKLRVMVRDRGVGMSRETLENQLLVLFRSTKEADPTKIGKFGIGFASVLAPEPEVVIVQTVRDGRRLTLHLFRDLTYELFDGGTATHAGTSVELVLAMNDDAIEPFVQASVQSLVRWCRHASVPLELTWVPEAGPVQTTRIDRPLAIENAIVQVLARSSDGGVTTAVGITRDLAPYTGFFNHGLTLYETTQSVAGRVATKIQDSRLGHTLSRDNVRRDEAYDRAVEFARALATEELPREITRQLRNAAEAGDHARYRVLAEAALRSGTAIDWCFPLADPGGDVRVITDLPRRAWTSQAGSPLAALLTASKLPVLDSVIDSIEGLPALLHAQYRCELVSLEREMTSITPVELADEDTALLRLVDDMLRAAGKGLATIVLAKLDGARSRSLTIAGKRDVDGPYLVDRATASISPFSRFSRPPLVISVEHPFYANARAADPRLSASLLARAILLEYQQLDVAASQRLMEHALDYLG